MNHHNTLFTVAPRLTLAALLALAFGIMPHNSLALGSLEDQPQDAQARIFKTLDQNGDGQLSRDEAVHDADLSARFNTADSNHDGSITQDEYAASKSAQQQALMKAFLDDSAVTAMVKAELLKDAGIRALAISVETHRGQVILSGFVDNEQQVRRAAEIAAGVRGVTAIKNSLLLKG